MLRQAACPVRGSAVGKPTRRKAGQAPHLDSMGARSGARRLGCEQPMSTMEVRIPYPSRPGICIPQGAQVTKQISPVRIGQPGGGHAAVVREIAVPRGDRGEDNGSG